MSTAQRLDPTIRRARHARKRLVASMASYAALPGLPHAERLTAFKHLDRFASIKRNPSKGGLEKDFYFGTLADELPEGSELD